MGTALILGHWSQHHQRVSCRGHEIIALFDHLAVLAMVQSKFFPPIFVICDNGPVNSRGRLVGLAISLAVSLDC